MGNHALGRRDQPVSRAQGGVSDTGLICSFCLILRTMISEPENERNVKELKALQNDLTLIIFLAFGNGVQKGNRCSLRPYLLRQNGSDMSNYFASTERGRQALTVPLGHPLLGLSSETSRSDSKWLMKRNIFDNGNSSSDSIC